MNSAKNQDRLNGIGSKEFCRFLLREQAQRRPKRVPWGLVTSPANTCIARSRFNLSKRDREGRSQPASSSIALRAEW